MSRKVVALLMVAGMLTGAALVTPAGAHVGGSVGHLWKKHIRPLADKRYFTKQQANNRFLRKVDAQPRAFARVNANGTVDGPRSKGITDAQVSHTADSGLYCFSLGFTPRQVQATVDWIAGGSTRVIHATVQSVGSCPDQFNDGSVRIVRPDTAAAVDVNFYVQFVR